MKNWQKISTDKILLDKIKARTKIYQLIRDFFQSEGFLEVETPLVMPQPSSEPYLEVFKTEIKFANGHSQNAFLTTSPEYNMKKLLSSGIGHIFQITKSFRNDEGISNSHNHEFAILEWYRVNADYEDVMRDCEKLWNYVGGKLESRKAGKHESWMRISVKEAFKKWVGVEVLDEEELYGLAIERQWITGKQENGKTGKQDDYDDLFNLIMINVIEPEINKLGQPVFLYDYPLSQAALSRKKKSDPRFAERFEWYMGGMEIGNAFSELTDFNEQKSRIIEDLKLRRQLGKIEYGADEDFLLALEQGLSECSGIAVGVDRLIMLLTGAKSISETMFFPDVDLFTSQD